MHRPYFAAILLLSFTLLISNAGQAQTKEQMFKRDYKKLTAELQQMLIKDQHYRQDSILFIQHREDVLRIDSANTARLIAISNKYGFPSAKRFNLEWGTFMPHIILLHSPQYFFERLKPLIERERVAGYMADFEYQPVSWHINDGMGRP